MIDLVRRALTQLCVLAANPLAFMIVLAYLAASTPPMICARSYCIMLLRLAEEERRNVPIAYGLRINIS